ncbi:MAG: diguanylate cyclase, partial [Pseudophaeobacter sp.]
TAEVTLTRQFRSELEMGQSIMDQMGEAIAVFANDGTMTFSNETYHSLWKMDPEASFAKVSIMDAARVWQDTCSATPVWGEIRDFVAGSDGRTPWWSQVQLRDGTPLVCKVTAIQNGATMVSFQAPEPGLPPLDQQKFAITDQGGQA